MGSRLSVTNDREDEVWWILEEPHKGAMIAGIATGGIVLGAATGGIACKVIGGALIAKAAAGAALLGVIATTVSPCAIQEKERLFRKQMMEEQRQILECHETFISGQYTLSLLRRITAKRFDVVTGKCYEISFNALTGATMNSVRNYNLSDFLEKEMDPKRIDVDQKRFLEEHTKSKVCIHCQDGYPEYVIVPCGHRCLCSKCYKSYLQCDGHRKCPSCRTPIQNVIKVIR